MFDCVLNTLPPLGGMNPFSYKRFILEKETHQPAQVSYPTKVGSLVSYKQPLINIFISLIELKSIKTIH